MQQQGQGLMPPDNRHTMNRPVTTPQEQQEAKRKQTLERELTTYTVERSSGLLPETMNDDAVSGRASEGNLLNLL